MYPKILSMALLTAAGLVLSACSYEQTRVTSRTLYPQPPVGYTGTDAKAMACRAASTDQERFGVPGAFGPCVSVVFAEQPYRNGTRIGFSDFANGEVVFVAWSDGKIDSVNRQAAL